MPEAVFYAILLVMTHNFPAWQVFIFESVADDFENP